MEQRTSAAATRPALARFMLAPMASLLLCVAPAHAQQVNGNPGIAERNHHPRRQAAAAAARENSAA